ncbi:Phosphoglycerate mutase family protein [Apiospora arundinis]
MLLRLAHLSFLALGTAAAPSSSHDAQSRQDHDQVLLASCADRPATAPDLLVRDLTYRALEAPTPFMPPGASDYKANLSFRVTNPANATEWSCDIGESYYLSRTYPAGADKNIVNPQNVFDSCYSREDPNPGTPGWGPPIHPGGAAAAAAARRATWFSFDKEANTLVVGQTVRCVDEEGHASTYDIRGEKELPLKCTFGQLPRLTTEYKCNPVDATISTNYV